MSIDENVTIDTKAAFLGPQAENKEILEDLIIDALRDYIYWRRNIHPEDLPSVSEKDKIQPSFVQTKSAVKQELFNILSELKKGAPIFSKRYFGHILSDLFIPSVAGYFAAMLYNQNNVVAEVSPVTIEKELDYIKEISKMFSYPVLDINKLSKSPKDSSWGHLSAGGTTANLEAMWVARNIKFFPLAIRLLSKTNNKFKNLQSLEVQLPNLDKALLSDLDSFQLLSLDTKNILEMNQEVFLKLEFDKNLIKEFEEEIPTIQKLGLINFYEKCKKHGLALELPKVIIPQTVHYCWFKSMDILGIGNDNLIQIPVDLDFRMNIELLQDEINKAAKTRNPVLALIGICGTTEEGAVDPLNKLVGIKKEFEKNNYSFWLHSDAAIGGYFASLLKDKHFEEVEIKEFSDIQALRNFDSIVIDPHKLGYVPYPAGAVVYKDSRIREHITYEAPYLNESENIRKTFIGKWTLEGSRPGASAISCYLSQHSFPLNEEGYGKILNGCLNVRDKLLKAFDTINGNEDLNKGFQLKLLYQPQLNIICYTVASPRFLKTPGCLNKMTRQIYKKLSVSGDNHASSYEYLVSKTEYSIKKYKSIIQNHLNNCGIKNAVLKSNYELMALRSVLMNPLVDDDKTLNGFAQYLCKLAEEIIPEVQIDRLLKSNSNMRKRIAIAEDVDVERKSLRYHLEFDQILSKGIEIRSSTEVKDFIDRFGAYLPEVVITDIKFKDNVLAGIGLIEFLKGKKYNNIIVYSGLLDDKNINSELDRLNIPANHRIHKSGNFTKDSVRILNTIMESFV